MDRSGRTGYFKACRAVHGAGTASFRPAWREQRVLEERQGRARRRQRGLDDGKDAARKGPGSRGGGERKAGDKEGESNRVRMLELGEVRRAPPGRPAEELDTALGIGAGVQILERAITGLPGPPWLAIACHQAGPSGAAPRGRRRATRDTSVSPSVRLPGGDMRVARPRSGVQVMERSLPGFRPAVSSRSTARETQGAPEGRPGRGAGDGRRGPEGAAALGPARCFVSRRGRFRSRRRAGRSAMCALEISCYVAGPGTPRHQMDRGSSRGRGPPVRDRKEFHPTISSLRGAMKYDPQTSHGRNFILFERGAISPEPRLRLRLDVDRFEGRHVEARAKA